MGINTSDTALNDFNEGLKAAKAALTDANSALSSLSASGMNWHDFQKKEFDKLVREIKYRLEGSLEKLEITNKKATKMLVALEKYKRAKI